MARIRNGILGGFRGKVGNVIGQCYDGVQTMRAMPSSVANPKTAGQLAHRSLFRQLVSIMSACNGVLRYSLWNANKTFNGFNCAVRYNFQNAIVNGTIDVTKLIFGEFYGLPFDDVSFELEVSPESYEKFLCLSVGWQSFVDDFNTFATDQPIIIVIRQRGGFIFDIPYAGVPSWTRGENGSKASYYLPLLVVEEYQVGDVFSVFFGVNSPEMPSVVSKSITIPAHNIPAFYDYPTPGTIRYGSLYEKYRRNPPRWFTNIVGE